MAKSEAQRQKKLEKKRQKDRQRKQRVEAFKPFSLLSPKQKVLKARTFPVHECRINSNWQEQGMATVLVSRCQPDGQFVFGVFLVDIFCLGLKNTFCNADFPESSYRTQVVPQVFENQPSESCTLELANQVVYGGIAYAKQFDFKPNKDFKLSKYLLNAPDDVPPSNLEFGKNGKPFFIAGPHDNAAQIRRQLESVVGEGQYDYLYEVDSTTEIWPE